jgi:arylsulfatase A-like enzyme
VRWFVIPAAIAAALPAHAALAQAPAKPNILVVMTDDQRADGTLRVMPRTRRLIGGHGTTFREAHATTPQCCPSRASFFTGLYMHNHGVFDNAVPERLDQASTVQRALRARGYRTAIFGKYLNSWIRNPPHFGTWSITEGGFDEAVWNLGGRIRTVRRYTTDLISDHAVRFLRAAEQRDRRPWLAWLTPSAPHVPSTPARRHRGASLPRFPATPAMREDDTADKPRFLDNARGHGELIATARDDGRRSLMAVDELVGRVMAELRRLEERRHTLVVFTSDNGLMLGEHGGVYGKDLPYAASTRIPLLVRRPGLAGPRRISRRLVTNLDVTATLFDVAGVRRQTDGRSLLGDWRHGALFLEHAESRTTDGRQVFPAWRSLRTRAHRYAEYRDEGGRLLFREHYDLERDPWELDNVAASLAPARARSLSRRLRRLARCSGRTCP